MEKHKHAFLNKLKLSHGRKNTPGDLRSTRSAAYHNTVRMPAFRPQAESSQFTTKSEAIRYHNRTSNGRVNFEIGAGAPQVPVIPPPRKHFHHRKEEFSALVQLHNAGKERFGTSGSVVLCCFILAVVGALIAAAVILIGGI